MQSKHRPKFAACPLLCKHCGGAHSIEVNGRKVFEQTSTPERGWVQVNLSPAEWQGQAVVLTFLIAFVGNGQAVWAEPQLVAER